MDEHYFQPPLHELNRDEYSGSVCDDVGWASRRKYTDECINSPLAYSMMYTPRHDV